MIIVVCCSGKRRLKLLVVIAQPLLYSSLRLDSLNGGLENVQKQMFLKKQPRCYAAFVDLGFIVVLGITLPLTKGEETCV